MNTDSPEEQNDLQQYIAELNKAPFEQLTWKMVQALVLCHTAVESEQPDFAKAALQRAGVIFSVMTNKVGYESFIIERKNDRATDSPPA